jgi:hypothetical protein
MNTTQIDKLISIFSDAGYWKDLNYQDNNRFD